MLFATNARRESLRKRSPTQTARFPERLSEKNTGPNFGEIWGPVRVEISRKFRAGCLRILASLCVSQSVSVCPNLFPCVRIFEEPAYFDGELLSGTVAKFMDEQGFGVLARFLSPSMPVQHRHGDMICKGGPAHFQVHWWKGSPEMSITPTQILALMLFERVGLRSMSCDRLGECAFSN